MKQDPQDLLAAVRASPNDDAPRHVLADLFEEHGDLERATFIRAQLASASLPKWDPQQLDLDLVARAALASHADAWRAELPVLDGVRWGSFDRGFVASAAFDDAALVARHADAVTRAAPLRTLALRWPRLGDRPELAPIPGLRELVVVGTLMQDDDMQWLARCPLLSTVDTLRFVGSGMQDDALRQLLRSPHLCNLRALSIPRHDLGNEAIDILVDANPTLVELDLSVQCQDEIGSQGREDTCVGEMGIIRLSTWAGFATLQRLDVTGIQLGETGLIALLASRHNGSLRSLRIRSVSDFHEDYGRPDVLNAFGGARKGLRLEELDLGENELTFEGACEVASSPALAQLRVLHFAMIGQTDRDLIAPILSASWMDSVAVLRLDNNVLAALNTVLVRSPAALHTLSLASDYAWSSLRGLAKRLARGPALAALRSLDLTGCRIDDDALATLGTVQTLPKLIELRLGASAFEEGVEYTEAGIAAFASSPIGQQLRSFVSGTQSAFDRLPPTPRLSVGDAETEHVL